MKKYKAEVNVEVEWNSEH